jgi:membrane protein YqaA with SNARE-associated domain
VRHRNAVPGALILNIPMLVAAVYLPAAATATMAVCLAALGAVLGTLAGWGIEQQRRVVRRVRCPLNVRASPRQHRAAGVRRRRRPR